MDFIEFVHAVIIATIEGLTEFLPVSSSGHMILAKDLLGYKPEDELITSFIISIQLASIVAISFVYRERVLRLFGFSRKTEVVGKLNESRQGINRQLNLVHVALGIVPPLASAFLLRDVIKDDGFNVYPVVIALIVGGIYMWLAEWLVERGTIKIRSVTVDEISYKQAISIGLLQCLSLWPGFSRAGSTMGGGLFMGVSYRAASDFSFIMAIPIMTAATSYELLKNYELIMAQGKVLFFATGFIVSFIVAYVVIKLFLRHMQKIKLRYFAVYRFILAIVFYLLFINPLFS